MRSVRVGDRQSDQWSGDRVGDRSCDRACDRAAAIRGVMRVSRVEDSDGGVGQAGALQRTRSRPGNAWTSRGRGGRTMRIMANGGDAKHGGNGGARGAGDDAARGRRRGSSEAMKTKVSPRQA
ncbi:hypothetical protein PVAP13_6NG356350 [Panicum virgatum]|uniref:Uncharacterized protein n=1 Tax=Panicum virgatum TaxID=38727 RepID=A0A8T0R603_PANVG|nr:hypothetical protein PVAP13_6NG356350 [Panicum virgatum]